MSFGADQSGRERWKRSSSGGLEATSTAEPQEALSSDGSGDTGGSVFLVSRFSRIFSRETLPQKVAEVVMRNLEGLLSCGSHRDICQSKTVSLTSEEHHSHSQSSSASFISPHR